MKRDIVVFEKKTGNGNWNLDFRLLRGALPAGACPLAIASHDGFTVVEGQGFYKAEVVRYAEEQSGHKAAAG